MRIFVILSSIAICVIALVITSTFIVTEGEYVVLTQFGKPTRTIDQSGLYFKRPGILETVNRFDRRIHTYNTYPIQLLLGDKNPIVLVCYVCWRIHDPLLFFQSLINPEIAEQKLGDMVNAQMGGILGENTLNHIINTDPKQVRIAEIEKQISENTNAGAKEKYGIEVVQIGIRRLAYPKIVAEAVYNRMRSERAKEARKYRAEGMEAATRIKARTDREVKELLAEAYRKAEIHKGEGDRQALEIYSAAYNQDKEFFQFVRSMETYKDIFSENSTLILSTDSELFRFLHGPDGGRKESR